MNSRLPSKLVAVVVPMYKKELTPDEILSLKHLLKYLGKHDKFIVCPESLPGSYNDFLVKRFNDKYFSGVQAYSGLLMSKKFYKTFETYKYILIYQLDCLVFSDQLIDWCKRDYDYIGAPWFKTPDLYWISEDTVGNGGFSLRKVASFLKVLKTYKNTKNEIKRIINKLKKMEISRRSFKAFKMMYAQRSAGNVLGKAFDICRSYKEPIYGEFPQEDLFWSLEAKRWWFKFSIAPVETALSFSFEMNPKLCFQKNHGKLPFGCHAWSKYDRNFWESHLIKSGAFSTDEG